MKDNEILLAIAGLIGFFGSLYVLFDLPDIFFGFFNYTDLVNNLFYLLTEIILIISIIVLIRVFIFWVRDCLLKYSKS